MPATDDADDQYRGDYDGDFKKAIATASRLSEIDMLYIDDTRPVHGAYRYRMPSN